MHVSKEEAAHQGLECVCCATVRSGGGGTSGAGAGPRARPRASRWPRGLAPRYWHEANVGRAVGPQVP